MNTFNQNISDHQIAKKKTSSLFIISKSTNNKFVRRGFSPLFSIIKLQNSINFVPLI